VLRGRGLSLDLVAAVPLGACLRPELLSWVWNGGHLSIGR